MSSSRQDGSEEREVTCTGHGLSPREMSKNMLIFTAKLIGLAYAISLIPLPLKLAHVAAIRSLLLWLLYSAVYIVRYSRRGNVPSGADKREGTIQKEVNYVKRFPVSIFYEPIIMPHHIRFMGSGKEPPCQN